MKSRKALTINTSLDKVKSEGILTLDEIKSSTEILTAELLGSIPGSADKDKKSKLFDNFKKLLGPLDQLNKPDDDEFDLLRSVIKLHCHEIIWNSALDVMRVYKLLLKNVRILNNAASNILKQSKAHLNNPNAQELVVKLEKFIASHADAKKAILTEGISGYQLRASELRPVFDDLYAGRYLNGKKFVISEDKIKLSSDEIKFLMDVLKQEITTNKKNFNWEKLFSRITKVIYKFDDQISTMFHSFENLILEAIEQTSSLSALHELINKNIQSIKVNINLANQNIEIYNKKCIEKNNHNYENFVQSWFVSHPRILSKRDNAAEVKKVVDMTIMCNCSKAWNLPAEAVSVIYTKISTIADENIRHKFHSLFDSHYASERRRETLDFIVLEDMHKLPNSDIIIQNPLTWSQLEKCLEHYAAKTEAQFLIKQLLNEFIIANSNNKKAYSLELRVYIEYLIMTLRMSSQEMIDEGILFISMDNDYSKSTLVGANRVVAALKNTKNLREFRNGLIEILTKIKEKRIMFVSHTQDESKSLIDCSDSTDKKVICSASQNLQLYYKHLQAADNNTNLIGPNNKFVARQKAINFLVQSAQLGHKVAKKTLAVRDRKFLSYEKDKSAHAEYHHYLSRFAINSHSYDTSQQELFFQLIKKLNYEFYENFEDRYSDILKLYEHIDIDKKLEIECKTEKDIKVERTKIILDIFLEELAGKNVLVNAIKKYSITEVELKSESKSDEESHTFPANYPFRIYPKCQLIVFIEKVTQGTDLIVPKKILRGIERYINSALTSVHCQTNSDDKFELNISAEQLSNLSKKTLCFIDKITGVEIARFFVHEEAIKFQAYGDITLSIIGELKTSALILENKNGHITLNSNIHTDNLYFASNAKSLTFNGMIKADKILQLESNGLIDIPKSSSIIAEHFLVRASDIDLAGSLSANVLGQLEVENKLSLSSESKCSAAKALFVNVGTELDVQGSLIAQDGILNIESEGHIKFSRTASINGSSSLSIKAKSLHATDKSSVFSPGTTQVSIKDEFKIDSKCQWNTGNTLIDAPIFKNNSPNVRFKLAEITVKDELINHADGKIKVKEGLQIKGGSFWNSGKIIYGTTFKAMMNRFFVNGLTTAEEFKQLLSNPHARHCFASIKGHGEANIVAALCLNTFSSLKVGRLIQTSIIEIDFLSMAVKTGGARSNIIELNLGVELPNLEEIISDVYRFINLGLQGEYGKILDEIISFNAFTRVVSLVRWILKEIIPAIGKSVDLVWSILLAIASTPALLKQIYDLISKDKYENSELIALLNSANNLVTQGLYIEGQTQTLLNDLSRISIQSTAMSSELLFSVMTLFTPTVTNNSVFKIQSGLFAGFNTVDRTVFRETYYAAMFNINLTNMSYISDQHRGVTIAQNQSDISHKSTTSGFRLGESISTNVDDEKESGTTIAKQVTYISQNLTTTPSSSTHADHFRAIADNADLSGRFISKTTEIYTRQSLTSSADMMSDQTTFQSKSSIALKSEFKLQEISNKNKSTDETFLHITSATATTAKGSTIDLPSAKETITTTQSFTLNGTNKVSSSELFSAGCGAVSGETQAKKVSITTERTATLNGGITVDKPKPDSSAPPALSVHSKNIDTTAFSRINAAHGEIDMAATNDINQQGTLVADIENTYAGHSINSHESTITNQTNTSAGDSIEMSGTTTTTQLNLVAGIAIELSGDTTANQADLSAVNSIKMSGHAAITQTLPPSSATADISPGLSLHANHVAVTGKVDAPHAAVRIDATQDASLAGDFKAEIAVVTACTINDSATTYISQEKLAAQQNLNLNGTTTFLEDGTQQVLALSANYINQTTTAAISGHGAVSIQADNAMLSNINVDDLSVNLTHLDVVSLLLSRGLYSNVHGYNRVNAITTDDVRFDQAMSFNNNIGVTARSIAIFDNIYSAQSMSFTATGGDIYVGSQRIYANDYLDFNAHNSFYGSRSSLYGGELSIQAGGDITNFAGVWLGGNYLQEIAGNYIYNQSTEHMIRGAYDDMVAYECATMMGGAGVGHDGVGFYAQAGGKFINDASKIISVGSNVILAAGGMEFLARCHEYISYYRNYHNWIGRKSLTIDYSWQVQPSVVYSATGSNTLMSSGGSLTSISTDFFAAHENNFSFKYNIDMRGLVLENREIKERGNFFGVFHSRTDQRDQFAVPTRVVNVANTNIISESGRVALTNTYIQTLGTVNIQGVDVVISAPILDHYYSVDTRGLTFNTPLQSMFSGQPLFVDYQALTNANNAIEAGASIFNSFVDLYNTSNNVLAGLRSDSNLQSLFTNALSAQIGYTHTRTTVQSQTVADNVGVFAGGLNINATNSVRFINGVIVQINGDSTIRTRLFEQRGAELHNSSHTQTESFAVGVSWNASPTFSASISGGSQNSTVFQNQSFTTTGTLRVEAVTHYMRDANTIAGTIIEVVDNLSIISDVSRSSSSSFALSASTTGDMSVQFHSDSEAKINQVSSMESYHISIHARDINLVAGKILAFDGDVYAETIEATSVKESKDGGGFSLSGNPLNNSQPQGGISTVGVGIDYENYKAIQRPVIYIASNPNGVHGNVSGDLDTKDADGKKIQRDEKIHILIKVPTNMPNLQAFKDNFEAVRQKYFPGSGTAPDGKPVGVNPNHDATRYETKEVDDRRGSLDESSMDNKYDDQDSYDDKVDDTQSDKSSAIVGHNSAIPISDKSANSDSASDPNRWANAASEKYSAKFFTQNNSNPKGYSRLELLPTINENDDYSSDDYDDYDDDDVPALYDSSEYFSTADIHDALRNQLSAGMSDDDGLDVNPDHYKIYDVNNDSKDNNSDNPYGIPDTKQKITMLGLASEVIKEKYIQGDSWVGKNGKLYEDVSNFFGNQYTGSKIAIIRAGRIFEATNKALFALNAGLDIYDMYSESKNGEYLRVAESVMDLAADADIALGKGIWKSPGYLYFISKYIADNQIQGMKQFGSNIYNKAEDFYNNLSSNPEVAHEQLRFGL